MGINPEAPICKRFSWGCIGPTRHSGNRGLLDNRQLSYPTVFTVLLVGKEAVTRTRSQSWHNTGARAGVPEADNLAHCRQTSSRAVGTMQAPNRHLLPSIGPSKVGKNNNKFVLLSDRNQQDDTASEPSEPCNCADGHLLPKHQGQAKLENNVPALLSDRNQQDDTASPPTPVSTKYQKIV